MAKLIPGKNDLATKFPKIADEADGWKPSTVTAGSRKKTAVEVFQVRTSLVSDGEP